MKQLIKINTEKLKEKTKSKNVRVGILLFIIIVVILFGIRWYINFSTTVKTDNAKVAADLINISAEISGKLTAVKVQEGDTVQVGQLLATVDDTQYRINLLQAEAALDLAKANYTKLPYDMQSANATVQKAQNTVEASNAQYQVGLAQCTSAQVALNDTKRQLSYSQNLYSQGAISKENLNSAQSAYEKAQASLSSAQANLNSAKAGLQSSEVGVTDSQAKTNALNSSQESIYKSQIESAQATYNTASLNLDRTKIKAPIGGTVVKLPALKGQNFNSGSPLCTIVDLSKVWVTANIEEKKVARIHRGDKAKIVVDAFPDMVFDGKVEEVSGASQSSFSVLPTENASGNYTKVAQRLSVKISVVQRDHLLRPGMSAVVTIKTK